MPNVRQFNRRQIQNLNLDKLTVRVCTGDDYMLTSNCIYEFECPCQKTYIGETKRIIWERIKEHRTDKHSHVFTHNQNCPVCNQKIFEKYEVDLDNAPDNICRDFIKDKFKILEKNLVHTQFRKTFEGLLITLKKPELNVQK